MARKTKYFFNPKSLELEKVTDNVSYITWRVVGFASLVIVLALILAIFFARFFSGPREKALALENRVLKNEINAMERQTEEMGKHLEKINELDVKVYRAFYDVDPPKPIDYRGEDFEELKNMPQGKRIFKMRQKLNLLIQMAMNQEKSFEQLKQIIKGKEEMINSIPSIQPVQNKDLKRMASGFGYRMDPFTGASQFHPGIDFTCEYGTEVYATADGTVVKSMNDPFGYGNHVIIDHGFGYKTLYGHLSKIAKTPGMKVKRGQVIGFVGSTGYSTGPHLHYEVRKNDDPLNPAFFFHNDLSDEQYKELIELSKRDSKAFD